MRLLSKVAPLSYLFFMRPYETRIFCEFVSLTVGDNGLYQAELSLCVTGENTSEMPLNTVKCDVELYDPEIVNNTYLALMATYPHPVADRMLELQAGKQYTGYLNYYGVENVADSFQPTAYVVFSLYKVD